jgi:hypothetical protein
VQPHHSQFKRVAQQPRCIKISEPSDFMQQIVQIVSQHHTRSTSCTTRNVAQHDWSWMSPFSTFKQITTPSLHILSNSSFINHPTIRHYILRAIDSVAEHTLTDWLTSWGRVLQKPRVPHPLKKFSTFSGTRKFVAVFTRAGHRSLSSARWIPSYFSLIHFNKTKQMFPALY